MSTLQVPSRLRSTSTRAARTGAFSVAAAVIAGILGLMLLLAIVLPYRYWDAFAFGAWSREIAETGRFHIQSAGSLEYQRPVFYSIQAVLWSVFGFHVVLGRLLSLAFTLLLLGCVAVLARRLGLGRSGAVVAILVTLLIPDVQALAASGLTDVPVAAMVALVAVLYCTSRGRRADVVVALAAAAATMTKSTVLLGLAGLVIAGLLDPRVALRERVARLAPIVAGMVLGLGYFLYEANRLGTGLYSFLGSVGSYYEEQAVATRGDALLRLDLIGTDLRLLVVFAVLYALVRAGGASNRPAALVSAIAAVTITWLLPAFANGGSAAGPFSDGFGWRSMSFLMLAGSLPLVAVAPEEKVPGRTELVRYVVWAAPVLVVWYQHAAYSTRLASAAWPALALLVTCVVTLAVEGARRLAPGLEAVPIVALVLLLLLAAPNLDGLGRSLWKQFWSAGPRGWVDRNRMDSLALGPLQDEVREVTKQLGPGGRVLSSDARLRFFFGSRYQGGYAQSCRDLRGFSAFVLLHDPDSTAVMEQQRAGSSTDESWSSCTDPVAKVVWSAPGAITVFAVGLRATDTCTPGTPATGLVAVFGSGLTRGAAERLRAQAARVGFRAAELETENCRAFAVVIPGIPTDAVARDFAAEAKAAGFGVKIERR